MKTTVAVFTMLALSALPALAADGPAQGSGKAGAPEEPKVKTTAFVMPHPDVDEATMVEVMRAIESGLKKNPRLEMKELDTRLAEFAQENPTDQIDAARGAQKDGQAALAAGKYAEAQKKLEAAVSGLAVLLNFIKKQELADAMASLAVARYRSGDKRGGKDAFVELLTWRADYVYDPTRLPPDLADEFDAAQRLVEAAPRMPLSLSSNPQGAQAYVDGKYIGVTPCVADAQVVGRHYVTLKREGFKKAVATAVVSRKGESRAEVPMERSEKYLIVEQARSKVDASLGKELIDPEADNLKQVLFVEHAVFVKAAAAPGGKVTIDAWLYDLRTRHKLSQVHQVIHKAGVEAQLASLPPALYHNVSYEGDLTAPVEAPLPQRKKFKAWWVWAPVAAGVVIAGGAVGAYYGVNALLPATCPSTAHCLSFQP